MRLTSAIFLAVSASAVLAQNCGPKYGNKVCAKATDCCSQYGWCDVDAAHCEATTCLKQFSGKDSTCAKGTKPVTTTKVTTTTKATTTTTTTKVTTTSAQATGQYASTVPNIDVCGSKSGGGGVNCPGAGINGYFYRCCSTAGHCGPKNNIQDQGLYCGDGCQEGFGECVSNRAKPPNPAGTPGTAQNGETCGPIVNKRCATGLCCSGSNFCGTGEDFCGAANWCQPAWGTCTGN